MDALLKQNQDFVYIHVEAPDEMGHQGSPAHKILSIEYLDWRLMDRLLERNHSHGNNQEE